MKNLLATYRRFARRDPELEEAVRWSLGYVIAIIAVVVVALLSGCSASPEGNPVIDVAPGYQLKVCETSVGAIGGVKNLRKLTGPIAGGVAVTVKWGDCGR